MNLISNTTDPISAHNNLSTWTGETTSHTTEGSSTAAVLLYVTSITSLWETIRFNYASGRIPAPHLQLLYRWITCLNGIVRVAVDNNGEYVAVVVESKNKRKKTKTRKGARGGFGGDDDSDDVSRKHRTNCCSCFTLFPKHPLKTLQTPDYTPYTPICTYFYDLLFSSNYI